MADVIVIVGAGSIGRAIGRRVSAGKLVVVADLRQQNADAAARVLNDAGFEVSTAEVDVSSRRSVQALVKTATAMGDVTGVIHAAGVSPSQAPPAATSSWTAASRPPTGTATSLRRSRPKRTFPGFGR